MTAWHHNDGTWIDDEAILAHIKSNESLAKVVLASMKSAHERRWGVSDRKEMSDDERLARGMPLTEYGQSTRDTSPAPATVTDEMATKLIGHIEAWTYTDARCWSDYREGSPENYLVVDGQIPFSVIKQAILATVGPALARLAELERRLTRFNELIDNVEAHEGNTSINYCAVLTEVEHILTGSDAEKGKT